MNVAPVLNFQDFIAADGDDLTTDSLKVAAVHKKRHNNVVALIRKRIDEAGDWGLLNFKQTSYIDPQNGQPYPMFTMTRDGYTFLVGKLTGKLATQHLIAFVMQDGKQLITDSRAVAIAFGKRHKNVLRNIDAMLASDRAVIADHGRLNFEPVTYAGGNGESRPMFRMTAKGLSELAMSFTGAKALNFFGISSGKCAGVSKQFLTPNSGLDLVDRDSADRPSAGFDPSSCNGVAASFRTVSNRVSERLGAR